MKKKLFLLSLLPILSQISCNNNKIPITPNTSTLYLKRKEGIKGLVKLETAKQVTDIAEYEDMIMVISQPTCKWCHRYFPLIEQFIENTESIIYEVEYSVFAQLDKDKYRVTEVTGTPTLLFLDDQKVVDIQGAASYDDYNAVYNQIVENSSFTHYYCLNDYSLNTRKFTVNGKEVTSNYYTLDVDEYTDALGYTTLTLENKINNNNIVVLYTWRRCNDCKQLKDDILDEYLNEEEHKNKRIYYYEVDGFMQKKREEKEEDKIEGINLWYNFNQKFSFSYYPSFSYDDMTKLTTSVTPTLISYPSKENMIYLNDSSVNLNEDKTLSYQESFFDDVKNIKTDLKVNDDNSNYSEALSQLQEKVKTFEKEKCLDFLKRNN